MLWHTTGNVNRLWTYRKRTMAVPRRTTHAPTVILVYLWPMRTMTYLLLRRTKRTMHSPRVYHGFRGTLKVRHPVSVRVVVGRALSCILVAIYIWVLVAIDADSARPMDHDAFPMFLMDQKHSKCNARCILCRHRPL